MGPSTRVAVCAVALALAGCAKTPGPEGGRVGGREISDEVDRVEDECTFVTESVGSPG